MECSYRLLRQVRATTTSRNPALRFFLLSVGLALTNGWVFLRWEFARLLAAGPRRLHDAHRLDKGGRLILTCRRDSRFWNQNATLTSPIITGNSTSGPITPAPPMSAARSA